MLQGILGSLVIDNLLTIMITQGVLFLKLSFLLACRCCCCFRLSLWCSLTSVCFSCSCSASRLLLLLLFLTIADILQDLLSSGCTSAGLWCLEVENFLVRINFRMQDDARWKSISEISDSIRPINVDITNINKKFGRVFVIVANDVKLSYFMLDSETCMEEFVELQMRDSDGNGQVIGLARHILFEIHFFDEVFQVELDMCQDAVVISARSSDNDTLKRVMRAQAFGLHCLSRQYNIDLFLFIPGIRNNNARALALILQFQYQIGWLSDLRMNDIPSLVEHCLAEEGPPCGLHGEFSVVLGHEMRGIAHVSIPMQQL